MKKQKIFILPVQGYGYEKDKWQEFQDMIEQENWHVVTATPILDGKSCPTFTKSIIYILEKEFEND